MIMYSSGNGLVTEGEFARIRTNSLFGRKTKAREFFFWLQNSREFTFWRITSREFARKS